MFGMMVVTWFLSMWISNTAATSIMTPLIFALSQAVREAAAGCSTCGFYENAIKETDNESFEMEVISNKIDTEGGQMKPKKNGEGNADHYTTTNVTR